MEEKDFHKFMDTETKIIEMSKWFAGEKMGKDPGEDYVIQWINSYGEEFRTAWGLSKCKKCKKNCFYNLKVFCEAYEPES